MIEERNTGNSSRYFRDDDYIGEDGLRHCARCKAAKEKVVEFHGMHYPDITVPCECRCQARASEQQGDDFEEIQQQQEIERVRNTGLRHEKLMSSRFALDNNPDSNSSKAMRAYVDTWEDMKKNNIGLLLQGRVGTGKSFYASCIANELIDKGIRVYFITAPEIISIASDYSDIGRDRKEDLYKKVMNWDLLIIDDLGAQRGTEFGSEAVFNVVNARYGVSKPLIVTTNMTIEDLHNPQSIEEERIIDRVIEMSTIRIPVLGNSHRPIAREEQLHTGMTILKQKMDESDIKTGEQ